MWDANRVIDELETLTDDYYFITRMYDSRLGFHVYRVAMDYFMNGEVVSTISGAGSNLEIAYRTLLIEKNKFERKNSIIE